MAWKTKYFFCGPEGGQSGFGAGWASICLCAILPVLKAVISFIFILFYFREDSLQLTIVDELSASASVVLGLKACAANSSLKEMA